ncbi:C-C motif chemokine 20-like [Conger conger]|uniref:C-C motif chemokine 20-like n=1 Tax=Conger conger TaxID=82655 RepID=UPI002A5AF1E8|nr:C-C motif chemokine 20-like [Conger conger]
MTTGITLCLGVFLLLCCFNVAQGELAVDCCLRVSHTRVLPHFVRGYQRQVGGNGCDISAVIFITRRNRNLCAPPAAAWVEALTAQLDKERKRCQDRALKRKRCRTLRF